MLTANTLYRCIDDIVEKAYLGFMFTLLGADMMSDEQKRQVDQLNLLIGRKSLIELLYILIRNRPAEGYDSQHTLNYLLDHAALSHLPVLNDAQAATLETSKAAFMDAIESTKNEIKKKLRQEIIDLNRQHRQHAAVRRIDNVTQLHHQRQEFRDKLAALIPAVLASAHSSFTKLFTSALTDTINDTVVDAATAESLFTGVPPKDTIVFKKVVNDDRLCPWCHKFYTNTDGSPKEYTLAQLQANGSNYGKPKSEWKPTLGKTHPSCRCQLFYRK